MGTGLVDARASMAAAAPARVRHALIRRVTDRGCSRLWQVIRLSVSGLWGCWHCRVLTMVVSVRTDGGLYQGEVAKKQVSE